MFDWVVATISDWGYLGCFVLMVAENLFPPSRPGHHASGRVSDRQRRMSLS